MTTFLLGINHNTASVDVREKVAFAPEKMHDALQQACTEVGMDEIVIVSTCNRTELYCEPGEGSASSISEDEIQAQVLNWLANYHQLNEVQLQNCIYLHRDKDAVKHCMKVASGLDSMVLGEPQILGQLKSAYAVAREAGTVGNNLSRLFEETFMVAKQVRTDTAIGENPVSVAFAAVSLAEHIFSDLSQASALMIGAGRTIELVVQHLRQAGVTNVSVANRTLERALELKEKYGVDEVLFADIPEQLEKADIVVSSTASQLPILGKGAVERALKARKHRPIFMVDLAVPRDIEPEVAELEDVYLYSVDDLSQVIDSSLQNRKEAAQEAEKIIAEGVSSYEEKLRTLGIVSTLKNFRQKAEHIRDTELEKSLKLLDQGESPDKVLATLARLLTNKLIHAPSVQMKKASADGRSELIQLAEELFELEASNEEGSDFDPEDEKHKRS
ncbi:MAG: glutamyl-tRNA reductase [Gammaproteobacteria bacterium]|nr:glutamyl-tRNA reductase [Gammaproteobacteria bacterium]